MKHLNFYESGSFYIFFTNDRSIRKPVIYMEQTTYFVTVFQTYIAATVSDIVLLRINRLPSLLFSSLSQIHNHFQEERRSAGFLRLQQVQVL